MKIDYSAEHSIGTNIGKVFRVLRTSLQRNFEAAGYKLTLEQWLMLVLLTIRDGQTQQELSIMSVKEKTTITRLIDGLEKKNLIVRVPDKTDRRNNLIYLTKEGKKVEKTLTPLAFETNDMALKGFTKKEIHQFLDMLKRMYGNLADN